MHFVAGRSPTTSNFIVLCLPMHTEDFHSSGLNGKEPVSSFAMFVQRHVEVKDVICVMVDVSSETILAF